MLSLGSPECSSRTQPKKYSRRLKAQQPVYYDNGCNNDRSVSALAAVLCLLACEPGAGLDTRPGRVLHRHAQSRSRPELGAGFSCRRRSRQPWQRPKEPLTKYIMNRVADINGMIARRATPVVVILRRQGAQHSERPFLSQPSRALALRAVCGVRLLIRLLAIRLSWQTTPTKSLVIANGMTIRVVTFLASHSAKPNARPCGT